MRQVLVLALSLLTLSGTLAGCIPGRMGCIREGEMISLTAGYIPVEQVQPGDQVFTASGVGTVVRIAEHRAAEIVTIKLSDGGCLRVTPEHPVATPAGWITAGSLKPSDTLTTDVGKAAVASASRQRDRARVFDLTVYPGDTFYASGVLVHNKTVPRPLERGDLVGVWVAVGRYSIYRLMLQPDGTGEVASAMAGTKWRELGRVSRLEFNPERRAGIAHLEYSDRGNGAFTRTLRLSGYRGASVLDGVLEFGASGGKEELRFVRESILLDSLRDLSRKGEKSTP